MSMRMHLFPEGLNNCKIKVDNVIIIKIDKLLLENRFMKNNKLYSIY